MKVLNFLLIAVTAGLISSCAQTEYQDVQSSGIQHSSPEVISLYENENEQLRRERESGGLVSWLLAGPMGSDPGDDDFHSRHDHDRGSSSADKKEFISKNGVALREGLRTRNNNL